MSNWSLVYEKYDPKKEKLREALCTLGNGYFATRGAGPEAEADDIHYPGTYLAGGYNRAKTEIAGKVIENEDLVNLPNWLPVNFRLAGGDWFDLNAVKILNYRQELDVIQGLLARSVTFRDDQGRESTLTCQRLVHMGNPHCGAQEVTLTAENWSGPVTIRTALDGRVTNSGVERYQKLSSKHLEPVAHGPGGRRDPVFRGTDESVQAAAGPGRQNPGILGNPGHTAAPAPAGGAGIYCPGIRDRTTKRAKGHH